MTKPTTTYSPITKYTTTYSSVAKNTTSFTGSSAASTGIQLDSSTVTLGSLTVYLHGFTSATPPNSNSTKSTTTYTDT